MRAQERDHVLGRRDADRAEQRVHVVADQIGHRMHDAVGIAPGGRVLAPERVDRTVLDDARRVRDALGEQALERLQRQRPRRPQQHPQRLAAQEAPAEDVVLALPGGQRLVRRQVVRAGRVAAARGQQPLAQHARLQRAHGAHPGLPARVAIDAPAQLRIGAHLFDRLVARQRDRADHGGDRLVQPGGVLLRLIELAARAVAIQVDDVARPLLQALAIDGVDAVLVGGRHGRLGARRQHRQRRRDPEHLEVVVLAGSRRIAVRVQLVVGQLRERLAVGVRLRVRALAVLQDGRAPSRPTRSTSR